MAEKNGIGLYEQIKSQESKENTLNVLTKDRFDKIVELLKSANRSIVPWIAAGRTFLEALNDGDFIYLLESHEIHCSMETWEYAIERYKKLKPCK